MKIKIFKKNDSIQDIELELQEYSQANPSKYFPEFLHFYGLHKQVETAKSMHGNKS